MPLKLTANGVIAVGDEIEDLVIPGIGVNPPGPVAAPTYNESLLTSDFVNGASNRFDIVYQTKHAMVLGADAYADIHLHMQGSGAAAANADWDVEVSQYSSTMAGTAQPVFTNVPISTPMSADTLERMYIVRVLNVTGLSMSGIVKVKLTRKGGTDAYAGDCRVSSYDMHLKVNRLGSRSAGVK